MREVVRGARAIVAAAVAADRRGVVVVSLLGILAWTGVPAQGLTVKWFIDAAVAGDATRLAVATVCLALVLGGVWYVLSLQQFARMGLVERTHHEVERRVEGLVGEIDGIEHLERPDYLDRVATLQAQSRAFGNIDDVLDIPGVALYLAITAALLISLHPALLVVPLATLPALWATGRTEAATRRAEAAAAPHRRMRKSMLELATGIPAAAEARLFEAGRELQGRHRVADQGLDQAFDGAEVRQVVLMSAAWTVYAIAFGFAMVVVGNGVVTGEFAIGDLFLVFYLIRGMAWQAEWTMWSIVGVRRALTAAQNYLWLVDHAASVASDGAKRGPGAPGSLRFEDVTFRYPGTDREVLSGVTLEVPAGSVLAVVGDNGAGKTTLVKLLARFYEPSMGRITIGEEDISELDVRAWRRQLSACLQDFSRFEFLAREAVGVGSLPAVDDPVAWGARHRCRRRRRRVDGRSVVWRPSSGRRGKAVPTSRSASGRSSRSDGR